eukprot:TRINITY_DN5126_c0_g1_i1.p1 TRINITY_DN5126_c0_g1~~TRINITY_DN5126_c0_g1_i1.p1  ORF type:complete len:344 (+),score=77.83 TRINITY_DN5126_c0_g1_i1:283-1314(+)
MLLYVHCTSQASLSVDIMPSVVISQVFSFRLATVFLSMYYYAFVPNKHGAEWTMTRLLCSLLSFMTVGQWWYMTWMTYVYHRIGQWRQGRLKFGVKRDKSELEYGATEGPQGLADEVEDPHFQAKRAWKRQLLKEASDPLWEEAELFDYDIFDDYTMSLIQFGYVTFFSMAFPLAPLLALLNNLVQIRVDAFKLCRTRRRPLAQTTSGIGVWDNVLEIMTILAVVTNCALVGVTSTIVWHLLPPMSSTYKVLVVVAVEHVLLFLKYWVESLIPRTPERVSRALQREHRRLQEARQEKRKGSIGRGRMSGSFGDTVRRNHMRLSATGREYATAPAKTQVSENDV